MSSYKIDLLQKAMMNVLRMQVRDKMESEDEPEKAVSISVAASQIDIAESTLRYFLNGRTISMDMMTLTKICVWLKKRPAVALYLDVGFLDLD